MIIKNQTKNTILVTRGKVADTFFTRLKGLLGSRPLEGGEGLLLKNEKSIHTFFMTFPIDVVYLNHALEVIKIDPEMLPFRLGKYVSQSVYILELPSGTIQKTSTTIGDQLVFI
jgi:uncharacterized membrane protein (UPF0127 family)